MAVGCTGILICSISFAKAKEYFLQAPTRILILLKHTQKRAILDSQTFKISETLLRPSSLSGLLAKVVEALMNSVGIFFIVALLCHLFAPLFLLLYFIFYFSGSLHCEPPSH